MRGYRGKRSGSSRERSHSENTDPRVVRTSCWRAQVLHSPAGGSGGEASSLRRPPLRVRR